MLLPLQVAPQPCREASNVIVIEASWVIRLLPFHEERGAPTTEGPPELGETAVPLPNNSANLPPGSDFLNDWQNSGSICKAGVVAATGRGVGQMSVSWLVDNVLPF